MVAGVVAGVRVARGAVVVIKGYTAMAAASGLLMLLWSVWMPLIVGPGAFPVSFYRNVVGALDGRFCPSYPVCSVYAGQAIEQYGLLFGSWLTMDRLIHEADDIHGGHQLRIDGELRLFDPLQRNDILLKNNDGE